MLRLGASIEEVRQLAGHTNIATTARYVHATAKELKNAVARFGGRAASAVTT